MTGAQILQVARRRAGLTQAELAERSGQTQAQLSQWEGGRRELTLTRLQQLVTACGLDLMLDLARGDRSLDELAARQQQFPPRERPGRLIAPVEVRRAFDTLEQLAGVSEHAVLIGGLASVFRGGPLAPRAVAEVTFALAGEADDALWEAGWNPVDINDRFAGLHARLRYEPPADGWELELIDNPGGVPDHRALRADADLLPGIPAVAVASVRDLWGIAGASPWHHEDRVRLAELSALLALEAKAAPLAG